MLNNAYTRKKVHPLLFTALLAGVFMFFLFYQTIALPLLLGLCFTGSGLLYRLGAHSHQNLCSIDAIAQSSRLQGIHCRIKCTTALLLLFLSVLSPHLYTGLFVFCVASFCTVCIGKLSLHDYIALLCVPLSFLLVSCLALLFEVSAAQHGVLSIPLFGWFLSVTKETQQQTLTLCVKATGALSCLYLLSLSTTMSQLIAQCKECKTPPLMIELMYLMYRYIFMLSAISQQMHQSAKSRLGFASYPKQLKSVGMIYSNLLAQSFRKASQCFDAMESRAYTGNIAFLQQEMPIRLTHSIIAASIVLTALAVTLGGML